VDLSETEELHDLAGPGVNSVDTANTDHKGDLGFGLTEEVATFLGLTAEEDLGAFHLAVLVHIFLGPLEVLLAVGLAPGLELHELSSASSLNGLDALPLLQRTLGNGSCGVAGESS
jgi:hypothetical protein